MKYYSIFFKHTSGDRFEPNRNFHIFETGEENRDSCGAPTTNFICGLAGHRNRSVWIQKYTVEEKLSRI